jgi:hypothetical protein
LLDAYCDAIPRDPRTGTRPAPPIQQGRLAEIARELLRIESSRSFRAVEIQRLAAVKLHGPHTP